MIKLIGVVIVIAGLLLRFNTLLVVLVAGFATGLVAGMSLVEILEAIGKAFVTNRYMSLLILVLPVIGILERFGMREKAEDAIRKMKMLTAGRVMVAANCVGNHVPSQAPPIPAAEPMNAPPSPAADAAAKVELALAAAAVEPAAAADFDSHAAEPIAAITPDVNLCPNRVCSSV